MSFRRTLLMQPDFRLYRESYDTAKKSNDAFAARFHLNHSPPPEQIRIQAEMILAALFDRLILCDDVLAALEAQPPVERGIRAACLTLARTRSEYAWKCNGTGWDLVRDPGLPDASYQRGRHLEGRFSARAEKWLVPQDPWRGPVPLRAGRRSAANPDMFKRAEPADKGRPRSSQPDATGKSWPWERILDRL